MDSAKLNDWMQVVGIFAIVASLVFVGLQMRQAQEIAIAERYQARTAISVENMSARYQILGVSRRAGVLISERFAAYHSQELSPNEIGALWFDKYLILLSMDNVHFQWESGFMNDDAWNAYRVQLKYSMTTPMGRFIIETYGGNFRPSFREVCLDLISENEVESN